MTRRDQSLVTVLPNWSLRNGRHGANTSRRRERNILVASNQICIRMQVYLQCFKDFFLRVQNIIRLPFKARKRNSLSNISRFGWLNQFNLKGKPPVKKINWTLLYIKTRLDDFAKFFSFLKTLLSLLKHFSRNNCIIPTEEETVKKEKRIQKSPFVFWLTNFILKIDASCKDQCQE